MNDVSRALRREHWDTLDAKAQEAAARVVGDMLLAEGWALEFRGLRALSPFVPQLDARPAPPRAIATFFDAQHELDWVLVPGGTLRGWGTRERDLVMTALQQMSPFADGEETTFALEDVRPYGAQGFRVGSMFRPAIDLEPFLTTAMPLLGSMPLPPLDAKRPRLLGKHGRPSAFSVHRDELGALNAAKGWRLPTARESQWMTGAGRNVFPWGDTLPRWMWDLDAPFEEFDGDDPFERFFWFAYESNVADWNRANGFGLIDPLVTSHWVDDDGVLSWTGGTGECYPWQACGEWAGFITAAIVPEPEKTEPWKSHSLRPVIDVPSRP